MKKGGAANRSTKTLPADTIILGFTGSIGSGCTYIADGIEEYYKYKKYTLSDILRDEARKKGISPTTHNLQNIGDELRASKGNSILVKRILKKIDAGILEEHKGIIIDSLRNDGEVHVLKQFPNFYLFSIHADPDTRRKRTVGKDLKFKKDTEFDLADERDRAEDTAYGQQVEKCNDLSDIIINNNEEFPDTNKTQKKSFIDKINDKYISLIENKKAKVRTPERLPATNESLMTIAYAESSKSSCLKRKVGCIIASVNKTDSSIPNSISESYNIISSGHNEVPIGTVPCVFMPYEMCYRDHLQENQAEKINNCPNCGDKIKISPIICHCKTAITDFRKVCPSCKNEIKIKYKCKNKKCKKEVFKEYLNSGGGKLLDMCRALHAEENALMNLTKIGTLGSINLVLYTTTYPCNLCANKIATAGIKKVVYADPYSMEDAKTILATAGITLEKFEGIKSSAYFRLSK